MANALKPVNLLNAVPDEEFFSREADIQKLFHAGLDAARSLTPSLFLCGRRKSGKTEVLKRVYGRLFWEQETVVPFFCPLPKTLQSAENFCREYFFRCVLQFLAFQRKNPLLVMAEQYDLNQTFQLAYESRHPWLVEAVDNFHSASRRKDLQALSRLAIHFPSTVALRTSLSVFVLLDDFHHIASLKSEEELSLVTGYFLSALQTRQAPHLFSGSSTRAIQNFFKTAELPGNVEVFTLQPLDSQGAQQLLEGLCKRFEVALEPGLSLPIVQQLDDNPFYLRTLVQAARRQQRDFLSARSFVDLYTSQLTGGNLHLYFSSLLHSANLNPLEEIKAVELLHLCSQGQLEFSTLHYFRKGDALEGWSPERVLEGLGELTMIDYGLGMVSPMQDPVLRDWIECNYQHKLQGLSLPEAVYATTASLLKRLNQSIQSKSVAHRLERLELLLSNMDCQAVPQVFLDHAQFLKAQQIQDAQKRTAHLSQQDKVVLPEMISVRARRPSNSAGVGCPETILIAQGFEAGSYIEGAEITWLAALCSAGGIVGLKEIQAFHQQCQLQMRELNLKQAKLWFLAEERFNQAAISFAQENQIFTSNSEQMEEIFNLIRPTAILSKEEEMAGDMATYELVIPAASAAELVAVRALEQAAENLEFDEKSKGQIRMAVMEACINAKELVSPASGRIHLRFQSAPDRLIAQVRVETPASADKRTAGSAESWNLKMLQTLMDDAKLAHTHFGLELVMVKYLRSLKREAGLA